MNRHSLVAAVQKSRHLSGLLRGHALSVSPFPFPFRDRLVPGSQSRLGRVSCASRAKEQAMLGIYNHWFQVVNKKIDTDGRRLFSIRYRWYPIL
jgi:hypothetical protein